MVPFLRYAKASSGSTKTPISFREAKTSFFSKRSIWSARVLFKSSFTLLNASVVTLVSLSANCLK